MKGPNKMQTLNIVVQKPMDQGRAKALLVNTLGLLYIWRERAKNRKIFAALDDSLLRDLGINAAERDRECAKPFWKA